MTQAELIMALPEGRLPPSLMQVNAADLLLLFGAGLLAAALLALLAMPFLARRPSRRALLRATRGMPPQERMLAIGRLLGHLPDELRAMAYGSAPPLSPEAVERIALKARRARR
ncbi:hypothetical protein [Ancylobacter amanitiformis]|uniref:Uncharacterized protein n=1 Tax=Ancylobacter amanitiformis TaxID=217069 RepID=A0ABU0LXR5_9HYPH|nr:hypothetical protein [Ancylobacter amanitiformis]MDQ0513483.1 hypothetical protein [Ancylobacter amanitiformis]